MRIAEQDFYDNIPLEDCELIPESVQILSDVWEYNVGGTTSRFDIYEEYLKFNEDGIFRQGYTGDGDSVVISVIQQNDNGTLTGMLYWIPQHILDAAPPAYSLPIDNKRDCCRIIGKYVV